VASKLRKRKAALAYLAKLQRSVENDISTFRYFVTLACDDKTYRLDCHDVPAARLEHHARVAVRSRNAFAVYLVFGITTPTGGKTIAIHMEHPEVEMLAMAEVEKPGQLGPWTTHIGTDASPVFRLLK